MPFYKGKEGKWITTETGRHVFIPDGESIESVLKEVFDDEVIDDNASEPEFDPGEITFEVIEDEPEKPKPEPKSEYEDKEFKETQLKAFKGIWDAPYRFIKDRFIESYMRHKVNDKELETVLFNMLKQKNNVKKVWIKTEYTGGGTYYNSWSRKLVMNISDNPEDYHQSMGNLFHEMGHALDNNGSSNYFSSTYISKKYETTLADMLKEEMSNCDIENLISDYYKLESRKNQIWEEYNDKRMAYTDYKNEKARIYYGAALSVCDTIQGSYGIRYAREKLNNYTHPEGYFDWESEKYPEEAEKHNKRNRGAEFFAEMTDSLVNDHEHLFDNLMKKYCPKSHEIYFEILKENYGYERK